jgi:Protein of unknown function (DUF2867)
MVIAPHEWAAQPFLGLRNNPMQYAAPVECDVPLASALQPRLVAAAYFCDSYRATLTTPPADVVEIFFSIFGHHPRWIKLALVLRNRIAKRCGLSVPTETEVMDPLRRRNYKAGDIIGPWPIYCVNDHELIAGRDNGHLDFRLSILREPGGPNPSVVVSTVCVAHNWFGKAYLFFIVPFHRWGVKYIISRALRAGRL